MNRKDIFDFIHFRNLVIIFVSIIGMFFSYIVVADSTNERYIQVDQDIWSFLKYVGIMFLGVLSWAGVQLVTSIRSLVKNVTELSITAHITQQEIIHIKDDVAEIKQRQDYHSKRLHDLEIAQHN
jgi:amino acid permease